MKILVRLLITLSPIILAAVVLPTAFVPKAQTVQKYKLWIPDGGREGNILDVEIPGPREEPGIYREFKLSDIHEMSLAEFKKHNYPNVVYGTWSDDLSHDSYLFYWAKDTQYPLTGVWAKVSLRPGFGQLFEGTKIQGNTLYFTSVRDWDDGRTPMWDNTGGAVGFYIVNGVAAIIASWFLFWRFFFKGNSKTNNG